MSRLIFNSWPHKQGHIKDGGGKVEEQTDGLKEKHRALAQSDIFEPSLSAALSLTDRRWMWYHRDTKEWKGTELFTLCFSAAFFFFLF